MWNNFSQSRPMYGYEESLPTRKTHDQNWNRYDSGSNSGFTPGSRFGVFGVPGYNSGSTPGPTPGPTPGTSSRPFGSTPGPTSGTSSRPFGSTPGPTSGSFEQENVPNCPSSNKRPYRCADKRDYLSQSRIYHPDKNSGCRDSATEKFQALNNMCSNVTGGRKTSKKQKKTKKKQRRNKSKSKSKSKRIFKKQ